MPHFYLTPKQDDYNKIPELQVCLAPARVRYRLLFRSEGGLLGLAGDGHPVGLCH